MNAPASSASRSVPMSQYSSTSDTSRLCVCAPHHASELLRLLAAPNLRV